MDGTEQPLAVIGQCHLQHVICTVADTGAPGAQPTPHPLSENYLDPQNVLCSLCYRVIFISLESMMNALYINSRFF